jgi:hypothetical protein
MPTFNENTSSIRYTAPRSTVWKLLDKFLGDIEVNAITAKGVCLALNGSTDTLEATMKYYKTCATKILKDADCLTVNMNEIQVNSNGRCTLLASTSFPAPSSSSRTGDPPASYAASSRGATIGDKLIDIEIPTFPRSGKQLAMGFMEKHFQDRQFDQIPVVEFEEKMNSIWGTSNAKNKIEYVDAMRWLLEQMDKKRVWLLSDNADERVSSVMRARQAA